MSDIQVPIEILRLPVEDRIELVEKIWDSIAESNESLSISTEAKAVLDQRLGELDRNPDRLTEAKDVIRELMEE